MSHQRPPVLDTLRISEQERQAVIKDMDSRTSRRAGAERREDARKAFLGARVIVQIRQQDQTRVNFLVQPRNISQTGLSFLHGTFLYRSTHCVVMFKAPNGQVVQAAASVQRCRHVKSRIHEVGVKFDEPLASSALSDAPVDEQQEEATSEELPSLSGRILYIEDHLDDRELLQFHLSSVGVTLEHASDGMEALTQLEGPGYDLIITGVGLAGMSGAEVVEALRGAEYAGRIWAMTADDNPETHEQMLAKGCERVIVKPYEFAKVAGYLAEFLPTGPPDSEPEPVMLSELWNKPKMRPLILQFLQRLEQQVKQIQQLAAGNEIAACRKLCLDVKGAAGGYGYPQISDTAHELANELNEQTAGDDLEDQINSLEKMVQAAVALRRQMSSTDESFG